MGVLKDYFMANGLKDYFLVNGNNAMLKWAHWLNYFLFFLT